MGHYIDEDGVKTDSEKVHKILNNPSPINLAELRTLLAMASYCRKFITDSKKALKNCIT